MHNIYKQVKNIDFNQLDMIKANKIDVKKNEKRICT